MGSKRMFITAGKTGHTLTANCKDGKECKACEFNKKTELESGRKNEVSEVNKRKIYRNYERTDDNKGVPKMPVMQWLANGSADLSQFINNDSQGEHRKNVRQLRSGVPKMPVMKWLANGKPDLSQFNQ